MQQSSELLLKTSQAINGGGDEVQQAAGNALGALVLLYFKSAMSGWVHWYCAARAFSLCESRKIGKRRGKGPVDDASCLRSAMSLLSQVFSKGQDSAMRRLDVGYLVTLGVGAASVRACAARAYHYVFEHLDRRKRGELITTIVRHLVDLFGYLPAKNQRNDMVCSRSARLLGLLMVLRQAVHALIGYALHSLLLTARSSIGWLAVFLLLQ